MIDVQAYGGSNGESSQTSDDFMRFINAKIDILSTALRHLSLKIHDNPEVRNKEFIAHDSITAFMRNQITPEWQVHPSAYGIATAFVAVYDSGRPGPVVSFNAEYGMFSCTGLR